MCMFKNKNKNREIICTGSRLGKKTKQKNPQLFLER